MDQLLQRHDILWPPTLVDVPSRVQRVGRRWNRRALRRRQNPFSASVHASLAGSYNDGIQFAVNENGF